MNSQVRSQCSQAGRVGDLNTSRDSDSHFASGDSAVLRANSI